MSDRSKKPAPNEAQRAAIAHGRGPLLVLAGAGSGKTSVVTQRIARLIGEGDPARSILAVTFTNKAAGEMHERVVRLVGAKGAEELTVCTFHRFGLDVLSRETKALGLRGSKFTIFDQADAAGVVREILRDVRSGKNYDIPAILGRISIAKNAFVDPETWEKSAREEDDYDEIAALVYPRYLSALRAFQAFDFDDLICEVVRLFQRRPDVLTRYQMRFRHVIVDEYQDTNHAQLELVRLLAKEHKNIMVVGDDDQAIYAWRGADVRNILDFESHFPGAQVVKLEKNYRSVDAVLRVANSVLAKAPGKRHKKTLHATRELGATVESIVCADPEVEAQFVATEVKKFLDDAAIHRLRPRDIAVLYRSNLQAQPIEAALKERMIPTRIIGGQQFFERKEVKDLIAYLRVALDPTDESQLRRIINYPARGIGDVALGKIDAFATAHDKTLWDVVSRPHFVHELPPSALDGCRKLLIVIQNARQKLLNGDPALDIARSIADEIGLKEDISEGSANVQAAARRWGNIEGLFVMLRRRDEKGKGGAKELAEYLRFLTLRQDDGAEEAEDKVTLTTMHGAKGLEFRIVFVVGLEEGILPHARTTGERATDLPLEGAHSLDEERRLFYVAVTRAKDRLFLTRCKIRAMRGKVIPRTICRFLQDVPKELLIEREVEAPEPPGLAVARSGAKGVLAALLNAPNGGELPLIPRRR